jgi:hypothetical protein
MSGALTSGWLSVASPVALGNAITRQLTPLSLPGRTFPEDLSLPAALDELLRRLWR